MENKKTPITHQLIVQRYKEYNFNRTTLLALPIILIVALVGFLYYGKKMTSNEIHPAVYWVAVVFVVVATVGSLAYEFMKYKKVLNGQYQITCDFLQEISMPWIAPPQYMLSTNRRTWFYRFRNHGQCPAYHWAMNPNRSEQEAEAKHNFETAQIGDQFYLVLINNRVVQLYSHKQYRLPEESQK